MNWNSSQLPDKKQIMQTFLKKVAGKKLVTVGSKKYHMPINYVIDHREVVLDDSLPIINLKNDNYRLFEEALAEYIETFFASEKFWANPISNCTNNEEKLIHALSMLWLNATPTDYENPIQFVRRYTEFVKDSTFDEFYDGVELRNIQTLKNCDIRIRKEEQEEFQETPDALVMTVQMRNVEGKLTEKRLPRISYGIAGDTAYIYGIQGYQQDNPDTPEMKKVNRARFQVNNMDNVPEGYERSYLRQEPYAYISLFAFLCMAKEKGIKKIAMPAMLPLRYQGKEIGIETKREELEEELAKEKGSKKEIKEQLKQVEIASNEHQRTQYTVTNKFLSYMSRMECDVPGIEITETPDMNNFGVVVDISQMEPKRESNLIFYELSRKIQYLMRANEKQEEGR